MKAGDERDGTCATPCASLKASTAIDHWQRDREEIEADELLAFALGIDRVDPKEDVPAGASAAVSIG